MFSNFEYFSLPVLKKKNVGYHGYQGWNSQNACQNSKQGLWKTLIRLLLLFITLIKNANINEVQPPVDCEMVTKYSAILFSSPEPKAHGWANSIPVTPSSVRPHFQTSSPLKPLGQLNSNFIWILLRRRERKFVQIVHVTWPRWPPRPYMVKTF